MDFDFKEITILAPAKINVCLGVTRKREDGYHDIDSVMQTVGLFDTVKVAGKKADACSITVTCRGHEDIEDAKNIAYRAAETFFKCAKIDKYDVYIDIEKVIPMEAGLGGGSSDAAATLCALNEIYGTDMSEQEIMNIGARIGADVPFLVRKGTAFVQGIGEKISPCADMPEAVLLIAYPNNEKVSTGKAYAAIDAMGEFSSSADFEVMQAAIENRDMEAIAKAAYNIFESVLPSESAVFGIKKSMMEGGALFSLMSGSGSAVFGVFRDISSAEKTAEKLSSIAKTFIVGFCRKSDDYVIR